MIVNAKQRVANAARFPAFFFPNDFFPKFEISRFFFLKIHATPSLTPSKFSKKRNHRGGIALAREPFFNIKNMSFMTFYKIIREI